MLSYEVRPIDEMPAPGPRHGRGLTQALRDLDPSRAIFIAAEGKRPTAVQRSLGQLIEYAGRVGEIGTHAAEDGVWVYVKDRHADRA